jgi:hypothetical protein
MPETQYRDLAEFGLPLVAPGALEYDALVREIQSRPEPFGSWPSGELDTAAVLLNRSGQAIVTLAYYWRYSTSAGTSYAGRYSNLASSMQTEVLSGRGHVRRDLGTFILPGSKRLITEQGMFGNNLDVLPPEEAGRGGGYVGAGGGAGEHGRTGQGLPEVTGIELVLDVVVLEDGAGLFESLSGELKQQRSAAREIVNALRSGASAGQIFEILRPLARKPPMGAAGGRGRAHPVVLTMFANMSIHRLVQASDAELLQWFEEIAQSSPLRLHRPDRSSGNTIDRA